MKHLCIASELEMSECARYLLLCDPPGADFGVYLCEQPPTCAHPLDAEQGALVRSALTYPPSVALTRREAREISIENRSEFLKWFLARVEHHLRRQANENYFLKRAIDDGDPDLEVGAYYWIVGSRDEGRTCEWVSSNFFVFQSPATSFEDLSL